MKPKSATHKVRAASPRAKAPPSLRSAGALQKSRNAEIPEQPELPEGWTRETLANLVSTQKGRKPAVLEDFPCNGAQPYLTAEVLRSEGQPKFIPPDCLAGCVICSSGDPILIWDGSNAGDVFMGCTGVLASTMVRLVPNPNRLTPDFLFYFLKTQFTLLNRRTTGSTIPHVNKTVFETLPLPLPPLAEQRAIAGVLRTVQAAREACERRLAATRQLKQSLLHHLFTYGPVPVHQADQVPLKQTELGPMPEHWEAAPVGKFAKLAQYGLSVRGSAIGEYPMLRMNNLQNGRVVIEDVQGGLQYVDLDAATFAKFRLLRDDVLFNRTNSFELVGKTALFDLDGDFVFASYLVRLRLDSTKLDPQFANYHLNKSSTQARLKFLASRGVSQSNINATKLKSFVVPVPPLSEQREIAAMLGAVDAQIAALEARRAALQALFTSLLEHLMTGRLRVPLECGGKRSAPPLWLGAERPCGP